MRVVLTDVDGSLLKPHSSSFGAAQPALKALQRRGIPVVLVGSRTRSELETLQSLLTIAHPFISEDGAAVYLPEQYFPASILDESWEHCPPYYVHALGLTYAHLRQVLQDIRLELQADIVGIGDWGEAELALALAMPENEAQLAQQREFSEVFTYTGDRSDLEAAVRRHHLQVRQIADSAFEGQWFLSGNTDKHAAVGLLLDCYRRHAGPLTSLGLSNDPSDAVWLQLTNHSVVLPGTHSELLWESRMENWALASLPGPEGWNDAVLEWLDNTDDRDE